jgi:hypothetical protein
MKHTMGIGLFVLTALALGANSAGAQTYVKIPSFGGAVMTSDNKTLIVALTTAGMLGYYDTLTDKQIKKIEVDFQPSVLAIQGKVLFAATKGAATVRVLDAQTGKQLKVIKMPGEPVQAMACHPEKGLLYVTTMSHDVMAVDPAAGTATKTEARGQSIAIDPSNPKYLYTGIQTPMQDVLVFRGNRISLTTIGDRAVLVKHEIIPGRVKTLSANDNAVVNGYGIAVRPDGKAVGMFGGGGWRSKTEAKNPGFSAMFDSEDLETMLGQIDYGSTRYIAFHPTLKLGAQWRALGANSIAFFNSKSFAIKDVAKIKEDKLTTGWMAFGGQGTKLIVSTGANLIFIPLELNEQDRKALKKAYP